MKWVVRAGALALVGMSLAACGGSSNNSAAVTTTTTTTTTTTPTVSIPVSFGANFGADFTAVANGTPAKVAAGDIIALTLTSAPIAVR